MFYSPNREIEFEYDTETETVLVYSGEYDCDAITTFDPSRYRPDHPFTDEALAHACEQWRADMLKLLRGDVV